MPYKIFISSVQSEFANQRQMLSDYLRKDALLGRFFEVFVFEHLAAQDNTPEQVYKEEVSQADIFLLLLGKQYGYELADGVSPTQKEYEIATANNKYRLAFLLNAEEEERHPKEIRFIRQVSDTVIFNTFTVDYELLSSVYSSLVAFLVEKGELRTEPFDRTANRDATFNDLSEDKIEWFVKRAKAERGFPLSMSDGIEKILTHLNLLNKGQLTNAAVLLFGRQPQRFFITSEVKCAHFHGTRVEKPIPFYQTYKGNLFELVDQAVDFVLSKIDLAVGTRTQGPMAPTAYEIPPEVIEEAIVNAIAHRDYDSTASVQVMLFADRLEIRNPGKLPVQLKIEDLKTDHSSFPRNPLIAEALYLTHYIERMGTGTQDMMRRCLEYGLPVPDFQVRDGLVTTIYRKENIAFHKIHRDIPDNVGDSVADVVEARQTRILQLFSANPEMPISELALSFRVSERTIQRDIYTLRINGLIDNKDTDKDAYWIILQAPDKHLASTPQVTPQVLRLLEVVDGEARRKEILEKLELTDRKSFRLLYLQPALDLGLLEAKYPDVPNHPQQRYRLTEKGLEMKNGYGKVNPHIL